MLSSNGLAYKLILTVDHFYNTTRKLAFSGAGKTKDGCRYNL